MGSKFSRRLFEKNGEESEETGELFQFRKMGSDQRLIKEWEEFLSDRIKNVKFPLEYSFDMDIPEFENKFTPEEPKEKESEVHKEVDINKKKKNRKSLF